MLSQVLEQDFEQQIVPQLGELLRTPWAFFPQLQLLRSVALGCTKVETFTKSDRGPTLLNEIGPTWESNSKAAAIFAGKQ